MPNVLYAQPYDAAKHEDPDSVGMMSPLCTYVVNDGTLPLQALQISMDQLRELTSNGACVGAIDVSSAGVIM